MTIRMRTAHTADLTPADLRAVRVLLDAAFAGDLTDQDFEHGLGGVHALLADEDGLVAHGSVVMRRVRHRGRWLRVGYVEGVGVRPDARRRGYGGQVMAELERIVDHAYDVGLLGASDDGARLYTARGWRLWGGRISALGPDGIVHLPEEEDSTYVRAALAGPLDLDAELLFDWRDGDVL
ncbi:GNAT family N-acetyltransferase [Streptomyces sp. NPDC091280]|uniref:GNAT family N-acetyltransferase n=1 Tax=Streptomyces sp. NPDC091280 TaxID=3365984 RepID=UPI0038129885